MNKCNIIRDLLPLYIDGVCSDESKALIDEHTKDCPECAAFLSSLKNNSEEELVYNEKTGVIERQAQFFRRRSTATGGIIAGILIIPVIVCLIVNLCVDAGLDWFFIVLASLLLTASITVVPLTAQENKFRWTLAAFTVSLILLFGTVCLYTGGNWFFVASFASLFGISVVLLPFALKGRMKAIGWLIISTVTYILMMFSIALYTDSPYFSVLSFTISLPIIVILWIIVSICAYSHLKPFTKALICAIIIIAYILLIVFGILRIYSF